MGVDYFVVEQDTYSVVKAKIPEGKTTCGLCSRLRRGTLYAFAEKIGATKIALGHHRDDIVETLFLNMFHGSKLAAMPPKLLSDDERNIVIRPLAYCRERDLAKYADIKRFPIIPCDLCGSQDNLQRQQVKRMLRDWERRRPVASRDFPFAAERRAESARGSVAFDFEGLRSTAPESRRRMRSKRRGAARDEREIRFVDACLTLWGHSAFAAIRSKAECPLVVSVRRPLRPALALPELVHERAVDARVDVVGEQRAVLLRAPECTPSLAPNHTDSFFGELRFQFQVKSVPR